VSAIIQINVYVLTTEQADPGVKLLAENMQLNEGFVQDRIRDELKYRYEARRWQPSRLNTIASVLEFFYTKPRAENAPVSVKVCLQ
jgi:hypothetical protein